MTEMGPINWPKIVHYLIGENHTWDSRGSHLIDCTVFGKPICLVLSLKKRKSFPLKIQPCFTSYFRPKGDIYPNLKRSNLTERKCFTHF